MKEDRERDMLVWGLRGIMVRSLEVVVVGEEGEEKLGV